MKRATDLFELIKSLSPSEKGYFKKFVSKGEGKKYLKLFEAINTMGKYDEGKLKKKLKMEVRNLSAAKSYLYEEVLESLRNYHGKNNEYVFMNCGLEYSSLCQGKNLFSQMESVLEKGLENVKRLEQHEYSLLYLGEFLKSYRLTNNYEKMEEFIETGYQEYLKEAQLTNTRLQIHLFYMLLMRMKMFPNGIKVKTNLAETFDKIEEVMKHIPYPTGSAGFDFLMQSGYIVYYNYRNDIPKAFVLSGYNFYKFLDITIIQNGASGFLIAYNTYMTLCRQISATHIIKTLPPLIHDFITSLTSDERPLCTLIYTYNELLNELHFQFDKDPQSDKAFIQKITDWMSKHHLPFALGTLTVNLQFAILHFARSRYSQALLSLNALATEAKKSDPVYYKTSQFIQLLIYFETKDWENFSRFLAIASKQLNLLDLSYDEKLLLDFFVYTSKNYLSPGKLSARLIELNEKLKSSEPRKRSVSSLFPLQSWLNAKINKISFSEALNQTKTEEQKIMANKLIAAEKSLDHILETPISSREFTPHLDDRKTLLVKTKLEKIRHEYLKMKIEFYESSKLS